MSESNCIVWARVERQAIVGWLNITETGRALSSMFFKRGAKLEYIRPGSTFRRVHSDRMEETAKVLSVGTDSFGIPHVHFHVSFRRPDRNFFDGGARMLALRSFADRYTERVTTAPIA